MILILLELPALYKIVQENLETFLNLAQAECGRMHRRQAKMRFKPIIPDKLNTSCVNQGDYSSKEKPPCTKPKLIAVSDIDKNGKSEYWFMTPYMWDEGIIIFEENDEKLPGLLSDCSDCSD